ncbi:hypothetical protein GX586_07455, partial [bacterium]|nr:hypothetical protein [bacterium]
MAQRTSEKETDPGAQPAAPKKRGRPRKTPAPVEPQPEQDSLLVEQPAAETPVAPPAPHAAAEG